MNGLRGQRIAPSRAASSGGPVQSASDAFGAAEPEIAISGTVGTRA